MTFTWTANTEQRPGVGLGVFFSYGFRPFFLGAAIYAALSMAARLAMIGPQPPAASAGWLPLILSTPVVAADTSVREITEMLVKAAPGSAVVLAGKDLSFLDLSGLDFKAARLAGANFYGADLTGANLRNADLSSAVLDRAIIVGADFTGANLSRAIMRLPHGSTSAAFNRVEAPRFTGANLAHARLVVRLDGADLRGANMTGARLHPHGDTTQNTTARRSSLIACDLSAAILVDADLSRAELEFANFSNADLTGASLRGANLSRATFRGAKLVGADVTDANFDGTNLVGVHGLDSVVGLDVARNLDRAIR